jgi:hypothetical protein
LGNTASGARGPAERKRARKREKKKEDRAVRNPI